jgi:hypothetical protein
MGSNAPIGLFFRLNLDIRVILLKLVEICLALYGANYRQRYAFLGIWIGQFITFW